VTDILTFLNQAAMVLVQLVHLVDKQH
jgi:hypothetical protein